jgi:hypothetical protein
MKQSSVANLALFLVISGWGLVFLGVASRLSAPPPTSNIIFYLGILCVLSSFWLSGYSFSVAKIRAGICAVVALLPTVIFLIYVWLV